MSHSDLHAELREMHDRLGRILGALEPPRAQRPAAAIDSERFDYANRMHFIKAEELFDRLEINEKRRGWFYNTRLHGVRLGELEAVIRQEDAEFRRRYPRAARGGGGRNRA